MTGPEHYRRAEKHLAAAAGQPAPWWQRLFRRNPTSDHLAAAQAHATLALVAATAMRPDPMGGFNASIANRSWAEALTSAANGTGS